MDTTQEYIEMSEKALKDLAEFQPHIQCEEVPHGVNVIELDYNGNWWFNRDNEVLVPLFRQDQLQEMLIDNYKEHWGENIYPGLMEEAVTFAEQRPYKSMEQLWLAFVMKEKYGKLWNGKDWVKK